MSNAWVISPNVRNDGTGQKWLERTRRLHLALMGWGADANLGRRFAAIPEGDLLIIAQGMNTNKRVYFAGYAAGVTFEQHFPEDNDTVQARRLRGLTDLAQANIPFNEDCAFGESQQPWAIYQLKQHNPADAAVIRAVGEHMETQYAQQRLDDYQQLLFAHHQIIFTGAPGTGKTHTARALVKREVGGEAWRAEFVQFHPSFDYTDFVEGLKPMASAQGGQVGFELRNGVFKEFCRRAGLPERLRAAELPWTVDNVRRFLHEDETAQEQWLAWGRQGDGPDTPNHPPPPTFFFVVDEINRADLSRVFGELLFALEPEYRGPGGQVKTQYANLNNERTFFLRPGDDRFFVPSNVYLIGTMNDVDRSVESFDYALRRRFAWSELRADEPLFRLMLADLRLQLGADFDEALHRYLALNRAIVDKAVGALGTAYQIGPAYFRKLIRYPASAPRWELLWQNHLEVLLHEYLRGMATAGQRLAALRAVYDQAETA